MSNPIDISDLINPVYIGSGPDLPPVAEEGRMFYKTSNTPGDQTFGHYIFFDEQWHLLTGENSNFHNTLIDYLDDFYIATRELDRE